MEEASSDQSWLLSAMRHPRRYCRGLPKRFSYSLVTSKLAILCLAWLGLQVSLIINALLVWSHLPYSMLWYYLICFLTYLLYPLFGYLGEKWTRYYVMMVGVVMVTVSSILIQVLLVLYEVKVRVPSTLVIVFVVLFFFGFELFGANIIQFSIEQQPEASTQELACFARWAVFMIFAAYTSIRYIVIILPIDLPTSFRYCIIGGLFLLSVIFLLIGICFKRYFIIEPPPSVDPLKLIYNVLKYGYIHKYPERRSAFTYNDNPSRLDYGKTRYGGPFTTDQVESVKSFWYILAVIFPLVFASHFQLSHFTDQRHHTNETSLHEVYRYFPSPRFMLVLVPPFYQFIMLPFFPFLVPTLLKRIWFGLYSSLASFICVTLIYCWANIHSVYTAFVGFNIISNISSAVISFSLLEFILAQSPCRMQGLLIGVWNIQLRDESIFDYVFRKQSKDNQLYIATSLLLISLIVLSLAIYFYKYRSRNELSDINARATVEEIYERNIKRRSIERTKLLLQQELLDSSNSCDVRNALYKNDVA